MAGPLSRAGRDHPQTTLSRRKSRSDSPGYQPPRPTSGRDSRRAVARIPVGVRRPQHLSIRAAAPATPARPAVEIQHPRMAVCSSCERLLLDEPGPRSLVDPVGISRQISDGAIGRERIEPRRSRRTLDALERGANARPFVVADDGARQPLAPRSFSALSARDEAGPLRSAAAAARRRALLGVLWPAGDPEDVRARAPHGPGHSCTEIAPQESHRLAERRGTPTERWICTRFFRRRCHESRR